MCQSVFWYAVPEFVQSFLVNKAERAYNNARDPREAEDWQHCELPAFSTLLFEHCHEFWACFFNSGLVVSELNCFNEVLKVG